MRRAPDFFAAARVSRGFTLIEMIVSIVITGIIVSLVAMFGRTQINSYIDASNRAQLSDDADTALRRVSRELQRALPNSVRQSGAFLEFVPISDAGRYRADVDGTSGAGNVLDFTPSTTKNSFDVLGPAVAVAAQEELVVFNLGMSGADVYQGTSRRAVTNIACANTATSSCVIAFTPKATTWLSSPQSRFHIVAQPVTYECNGTSIIRRTGYGFQVNQPTNFAALGGSSAILVSDVDCANTSFSYAPAVLQRNGLVVLKLTLTRNNETVTLLHQVEILNTP